MKHHVEGMLWVVSLLVSDCGRDDDQQVLSDGSRRPMDRLVDDCDSITFLQSMAASEPSLK